MLQRAREMGDDIEHQLPIVSICVVTDKHKCPTGFVPVRFTKFYNFCLKKNFNLRFS